MRITTNTSQLLEVRSSASAQRIVCALMAVLGLVLFGIQLLPDAESSLPIFLVGGVMTIFGCAGLALLRTVHFRVDTAAGDVLLRWEGLRQGPVHRFATADVADVTLEEQLDSDGDAGFRVTVVLRDGRRYPLTSSHSPHHATLASVAQAARILLFPDAPPLLPPRGHLVPAHSLRNERLLVIGMLLFASIFVGVGVHYASVEQRKLRHFRPVAIIVEEVRVDSRPGSEGGQVRRPVVTYRYEVDGVVHRSDRVTPLDEWRQGNWAREIVDGFTPGREYRGYYDPLDPSRAFLMKRRSAMPILMIAIPLFGVLLLSFGGFQHLRQSGGRGA
jgi:hypothetical protein